MRKKLLLLIFLVLMIGCNKMQTEVNKVEEIFEINKSVDFNKSEEIKVNVTINNTEIEIKKINEVVDNYNNCKSLLSIKRFNKFCNSNANETSTIELLSSYDVKRFCSTEFDIDLYSYAIINSIDFVNYNYATKYFDNKKSSFFLKNLDRLDIENKNFIANSESYVNIINKNKYIKVNVLVLNQNNIIEIIFNFEKNKGNFCSKDGIVKLIKAVLDMSKTDMNSSFRS